MRKTFFKKGLRELKKNWVKYGALIVVLALGVAMYTSMYDMLDSRKLTFDKQYEKSMFMDLEVKFDYGLTANVTAVNEVLSVPEIADKIKAVEYRLSYDVFLNLSTGSEVKTTKGIVYGYYFFDDDGSYRQLDVNRPLFFEDKDDKISSGDSTECYIESKYARAHDLGSGDEVTVVKGHNTLKVDIVEKVNIPEYFIVVEEGSFIPNERSLGIIMVPIGIAMEIFSGDGYNEILVNDIVFILNDSNELEAFREDISHEFEKIGIPVKTTSKEENPARTFIKSDLESDEEFMTMFPGIIFMVAAFGLIMALRRMIQTHKAQIGVFKSLGVPDKYVLIYFALIGLMIAVLGTVIGYIAAIPINNAFEALVVELGDWAVHDYQTNVNNYIIAGSISLVLCLLCTIIPAWWALRIKPIDAIQQREGITKKGIGKISRKAGRANGLPVPLKLAMRNLLRKPGRTTTTIIGVAISLALFLSFYVVLDSMIIFLDQNEENSTWDYEVTMEVFNPVMITSDWQSGSDSILDVNHGILLPLEISRGEKSEVAILYALEDVKKAFKMEFEDGDLEPDRIVISFYHADELGVTVGDTISMNVPYFDPELGFSMIDVDVVVSGIQDNHFGYFMFMDISTLYSHTNLYGMTNIVYLRTVDGRDSRDLENMIITTNGVSGITYRAEQENLMEPYLDLIMASMYLVGLLSAALAAALVYNLFMINAEEKKRDYATMKTLGTSIKRLGYLIFIEAGFITALGLTLGGILGYYMAVGMFANASELEILNLQVMFSWNGFFAGTIIIILVVLIVSFLTIRYISKIHIANVIRERSTG